MHRRHRAGAAGGGGETGYAGLVDGAERAECAESAPNHPDSFDRHHASHSLCCERAPIRPCAQVTIWDMSVERDAEDEVREHGCTSGSPRPFPAAFPAALPLAWRTTVSAAPCTFSRHSPGFSFGYSHRLSSTFSPPFFGLSHRLSSTFAPHSRMQPKVIRATVLEGSPYF